MKKSAFTMIELVFVIVILGILAAVAIPKMTNIKDDAVFANANESFCLQLKPFLLAYNSRKDTVDGFDFNAYFPAKSLQSGWAYTTDGKLKKAENIIAVNDTDTTNIKAVIENTDSNVYVWILDGNATEAPRCFISNSSTKTTKSADDLRKLEKNYL
jgi:prepilin-type N-terminal cleavage/methylation domain-containing protein